MNNLPSNLDTSVPFSFVVPSNARTSTHEQYVTRTCLARSTFHYDIVAMKYVLQRIMKFSSSVSHVEVERSDSGVEFGLSTKRTRVRILAAV